MAPFPETEIMTIKRLEVALRKMDFKLLKDGAYKLHEKYHNGFDFKYIDMLKEILEDVQKNALIPDDIRDMLVPTIQDILETKQNYTRSDDATLGALSYGGGTMENEINGESRVSSLTSLSYGVNNEEKTQEPVLNQSSYVQSPFEAQSQLPLENTFSAEAPDMNSNNPGGFETFENVTTPQDTMNSSYEQQSLMEEAPQVSYEQNNETFNSYAETQPQVQTQAPTAAKTVSIYFGQDSSDEKIKNIRKYRELTSSIKDNEIDVDELFNLQKEINTQVSASATELNTLFEQLKTKENKVNLITNSQSADFINMLSMTGSNWGLFNEREKVNYMPIMGLSNLFKCSECENEYLNTNELKPFALQCPSCGALMFPSYYCAKDNNCEINIEYYNKAIVALSNSNTWLLVHISINEKMDMGMIRSALSMNSKVDEIYILDKDINVRETYKQMISSINKNIKINTQLNAVEDFMKSLS